MWIHAIQNRCMIESHESVFLLLLLLQTCLPDHNTLKPIPILKLVPIATANAEYREYEQKTKGAN